MERDRYQSGLTLVELLVAVTILAMATVVALALYDAARKSYKIGENVTEQQQTVRVAFDLLAADLRMAGFNTNPDDDRARPDEQIEAAWSTAIAVRADFDAKIPGQSATPEDALAAGRFSAVSTGNDEIRLYVLQKPDGSSVDTLAFEADVVPAARDGAVERVDVAGVALAHDAPPYTLYRLSLSNDPANYGSPAFVNRTVIAENVRSLRFTYFDQAGNEIAPPGGDDTSGAIAARAGIHTIRVSVEALTRDPDLGWEDRADSNPATRKFRKFLLASQVTPRNLRKRGIRDLIADNVPPSSPGSPQAYDGHCGGLYIDWPPSPSTEGVAYYRLHLGTDPFVLDQQRYAATPGYYFGDLLDATAYYLAVQAVDDSGNPSPLSTTNTITTQNFNVPGAPVAVSATDDQPGEVRLQWAAVTENTAATPGDPDSPMIRELAGYRLYRGGTSGFSPSPVNLLADESSLPGVAVPAFVDDQVANCRRYYYQVRAVDQCGLESGSSVEVSGASYSNVPPVPPTGLIAHYRGSDRVRLKWSPVYEDENGDPVFVERYNLYRSPVMPDTMTPTVPGDFGFITAVGSGYGTAYEDRVVVPPGSSVWYLVRATDECTPANESGPSSITRPACSFSGEVVFLAPAVNGQVQGATGVRVHVSNGSGTYETLRLTFTSQVDGSSYVETINQTASTWDYTWQAGDQPPFVPGPYDITAEVDQRIDPTTVCTDSKTIRVHLQD